MTVVKASLDESDVVWSLGTIANEMYDHGGSLRRSVILFAYGSNTAFNVGRSFILPEPWKTVRNLMRSIISLDGIIVVPSGNARRGSYRESSDIFPALFTRSQLGLLPLTLVGSCYDDGLLAPFSQQSPHIKAWAPGFRVQCGKSPGMYEEDSGTSVSTGMVSLSNLS